MATHILGSFSITLFSTKFANTGTYMCSMLMMMMKGREGALRAWLRMFLMIWGIHKQPRTSMSSMGMNITRYSIMHPSNVADSSLISNLTCSAQVFEEAFAKG